MLAPSMNRCAHEVGHAEAVKQGRRDRVQCWRGEYLSRSAEAMVTQASLSAGLICRHKAASNRTCTTTHTHISCKYYVLYRL